MDYIIRESKRDDAYDIDANDAKKYLKYMRKQLQPEEICDEEKELNQ